MHGGIEAEAMLTPVEPILPRVPNDSTATHVYTMLCIRYSFWGWNARRELEKCRWCGTFDSASITAHFVQLVIPESFHQTYTEKQRPKLWTVSTFVDFVKTTQR
jgi:hypothetical protein